MAHVVFGFMAKSADPTDVIKPCDPFPNGFMRNAADSFEISTVSMNTLYMYPFNNGEYQLFIHKSGIFSQAVYELQSYTPIVKMLMTKEVCKFDYVV